jgi:hypothetical protein
MPRQMKYALLLLAGLLTLAGGLCWFWGGRGRPAGAAAWGRGELKVSERGYYIQRISSTIEAARTLELRAGRSAFVCLVMDTTRKRIWIESNGHVLPEYDTELPPSMDWRLYRSTPEGTIELPALGRFRLPPRYPGWSFLSEQVSLVGTRGRQEGMHFSFRHDSLGYGSGLWNPRSARLPPPPQQTAKGTSGVSIIISDADYERAKARFPAGESTPVEPAALSENRTVWLRAERRLCQQIESHLSSKGLRLERLTLTHAPDFTAAWAELGADYRGLPRILRGKSSGQVWLKIDYLGNDVWYARSAQNPDHPVPIPPHLDLEFLIPATNKVARRNVAALLTEGRRKQDAVPPPSKWRLDLPNGASVEFIGVCENPSGGQPWWGPDGSPLGFAPYVNYKRYGPEWEGRTTYEVAWRLHLPSGSGKGLSVFFDGRSPPYSPLVYDRYGDLVRDGLEANGYVCDKSRTKTTFQVKVQVNSGEIAWATFKNVSLVRGKDQGFGMTVGEGAE